MLALKLKQLRESCVLTQKQISDVLRIDRSTYTYYETGKSSPTISTLIKLAKMFGVSVDYLLDYKIEERSVSSSNLKSVLYEPQTPYQKSKESSLNISLNDNEKNLLLLYRLLSEEDKDKLIVMANQIFIDIM
ncbi:MAG: helix-turn-helix transcriptional regulator [Oscillospiraceae bacterium]